MKQVRDFLRAFDGDFFYVIYWGENDDFPIWDGNLSDTPWWVAEMKLDYKKAEDHMPISFRHSLGEKYNNAMGLVICVEED